MGEFLKFIFGLAFDLYGMKRMADNLGWPAVFIIIGLIAVFAWFVATSGTAHQ